MPQLHLQTLVTVQANAWNLFAENSYYFFHTILGIGLRNIFPVSVKITVTEKDTMVLTHVE